VMQAQAMAMAPQLAMRPSGVLVAAMELLAMASVELDQLVDRELAANPALERSERPLCPLCGADLAAERCAACRRERRDGVAPAPPELALQSEPTLAETLRAEVHLQLAQRDRPIAEYLLDALASIVARGLHEVAELRRHGVEEDHSRAGGAAAHGLDLDARVAQRAGRVPFE